MRNPENKEKNFLKKTAKALNFYEVNYVMLGEEKICTIFYSQDATLFNFIAET